MASCVARKKRTRHSQEAPEGPGLWRVGKAEIQYTHKEVASEVGQKNLAGACAWVQSVEVLSVLQKSCSVQRPVRTFSGNRIE